MEHDGHADRRGTPRTAKRDRSNPSAKLYPIGGGGEVAAAASPSTIRRPRRSTSSTRASARSISTSTTIRTIRSGAGGGGLVGWVNTKVLDETHDAGKAQGWTALVVDTNGNGKRDAYVEPNEPVDPRRTSGSGRASTA